MKSSWAGRGVGLFFGAALLLLVGCGQSPEDRLAGIWSYDPQGSKVPDISALPLPGMEQRVEQIQGFLRNTRLKLLTDHTFVYTGSSMATGTWSYVGGKLLLKPDGKAPKLLFGRQDLKADVSRDEKYIVITQETPMGSVVLRLKKTG